MPRHPSLPPVARLDAAGNLLCPVCGDIHLHHGPVLEITRGESARVCIAVTCELCHGYPASPDVRPYVLVLEHHEGTTPMSWELR